MTYFISYDIQENKIRSRVAKYLEGIGYRVQYSLFTAKLNERDVVLLKKKLQLLTRTAEDALLLIVPVCRACEDKIWKRGNAREEMKNYVII